MKFRFKKKRNFEESTSVQLKLIAQASENPPNTNFTCTDMFIIIIIYYPQASNQSTITWFFWKLRISAIREIKIIFSLIFALLFSINSMKSQSLVLCFLIPKIWSRVKNFRGLKYFCWIIFRIEKCYRVKNFVGSNKWLVTSNFVGIIIFIRVDDPKISATGRILYYK